MTTQLKAIGYRVLWALVTLLSIALALGAERRWH